MVSVEVPLDTLASHGALCDLFDGLPPQVNLWAGAAIHGAALGLKLVLLRHNRSMEVRIGGKASVLWQHRLLPLLI